MGTVRSFQGSWHCDWGAPATLTLHYRGFDIQHTGAVGSMLTTHHQFYGLH